MCRKTACFPRLALADLVRVLHVPKDDRIVMGRQIDQGALFCAVRLGKGMPTGHTLRRIDSILDLSFVSELTVPHYARGGRPSILNSCCGSDTLASGATTIFSASASETCAAPTSSSSPRSPPGTSSGWSGPGRWRQVH